MKVFYNKNKLLYNLELFLVYILSYMVDYTRKHLNALWLTETLAECTKHTMTGWPARKACAVKYSVIILAIFFSYQAFRKYLNSKSKVNRVQLSRWVFWLCLFVPKFHLWTCPLRAIYLTLDAHKVLVLALAVKESLFERKHCVGWSSFVYHRVHSRLVWFKERESTRVTKSGRRKAR